MKIVTNTALLVSLAMYFITALISVNYAKHLPNGSELIDEQTLFALTYAIYFLLWVLANSYFLNQIARIPEDRRTQFEIVKWLLRLELFALIVMALTTAGIFPFYDMGLFGLAKNDLVELTFVLLAILALFTFTYFYSALGREKENNASKLIKARIELMQYAILAQIIVSFVIVIGAGLLLSNLIPEDRVVEFGLFTVTSIVSLVTNIIMLSSINIPQRVRVRFNIAPKRFKFVMQS